MKHKETKVFLHSHPDKYPLKYPDGRISSQGQSFAIARTSWAYTKAGQQVTGYAHNDTNNHWQVIPTKALPETGRGRVVQHNDVIQLRHVKTDTLLLTHDVACPHMPTNQEFTTWPVDDNSRYNDTLFIVEIADGLDGDAWKSKAGYFHLVHVPTRVNMWTHTKALPEWAFKQQEINGNKKTPDRSFIWFVNDIITEDSTTNRCECSMLIFSLDPDGGDDAVPLQDRKVRKMNFFRKFGELQILMLQHNAGLTASHPYASSPISWPYLFAGMSFWTENDTNKQIYMIGNIIGWWTASTTIFIFVGMLTGDLIGRRRGEELIPDRKPLTISFRDLSVRRYS